MFAEIIQLFLSEELGTQAGLRNERIPPRISVASIVAKVTLKMWFDAFENAQLEKTALRTVAYSS